MAVTTARSVWMVGPRQIELRREAVPPPGAREVLIEAELSGISAGTELLVFRGLAPPSLAPDLPTVQGSFSYPLKFGYASVGRVLDVGPDVTEVRADQRVFALHPHQERYVAPLEVVVPLPAELPSERAIFYANLETAFTVLLDAHPRLGERLAIFGQGIVGLLITRLARLAGAGLIVAVDPFPTRRAAALEMGADLALDPSEATPERLRALADGRGLDVAIEASGSGEALQAAIESVAFQGKVVVCAWYGAREVALRLGERFHRERVRLISSQVSRLDPALWPRWDRRRRTAQVLELLGRWSLERLISHRVPLEQADAAYRLLDEQPGEALQVVLVYGESEG